MNISSEEENAHEHQSPTKKKKTGLTGKNKNRKHNPAIYNDKLEKEFPFIRAHPSDPSKAQCKLCPSSTTGRRSTFRCERSDIERHLKSERHVASFNLIKAGNAKSLESFLSKEKINPLDEQRHLNDMDIECLKVVVRNCANWPPTFPNRMNAILPASHLSPSSE
ncbi:uncharacterized protein LOC117181254 [Belonocnema kinseyi]|uniref:uncharacterized protein LOC117181254 n=1 Tax=Belonocnema kinseyi TaxID=2817044 RepID=UPI00143D5E3B|nr:uncharacterized protein LOC117181254 [Belonocnema kinseyi]